MKPKLEKWYECEICSVEYETADFGELVNGADPKVYMRYRVPQSIL